MNNKTKTLALTLGILAGIMGIEHGIGEVLEGNRPTESIFILSWPDSAFFKIMSGEPAMPFIPNYLLTGLITILLSLIFLVILIKTSLDRKSIGVLFVLLIMLLSAGGGFGPPILGAIALLVALKQDSQLRSWSKLPVKLHRILSALWPWSFGFCLLGWMMLFPGAALISFYTAIQNTLLMLIPIIIAFIFIPITMLLGFSRDILMRNAELPDLSE